MACCGLQLILRVSRGSQYSLYKALQHSFVKSAVAFWGQNERKIDSLISEMLVQKASDISACVMYLCKEQMFPL